MKKTSTHILAALAMGIAIPTLVSAQIVATDNASDVVYDDGWDTADDGGSGWGSGWTLGAGSTSGQFISSSTANGDGDTNLDNDIDVSGESWGMFANTGETADAVRDLPFAMRVGDVVQLAYDNGYIDTGASVGFNLRNAAGDELATFYFQGGSPNYSIIHDGSLIDTGIGFSDEGMTVEVEKTGATTVDFRITPLGGSTTTLSANLIDPGTGQDISQLRLYNFNAGSGGSNDAYFNSIQVSDTVAPDVSSIGGTASTDPIDGTAPGAGAYFTVTFDEDVFNLNTSADVTIVTTGGVTYDTGSVLIFPDPVGQNQVYQVGLANIAGTGTISLAINTGSDIADIGGNGLAGGGTPFVFDVDAQAPTEALDAAADVTTAGGATHQFTVTYTDNFDLNSSTFDSADITVTGPASYSETASFVSVDVAGDGSPRTVTYQIPAAGGTWDAADNGTYTIVSGAGTIEDGIGIGNAGATLGTFDVAISTSVGDWTLLDD